MSRKLSPGVSFAARRRPQPETGEPAHVVRNRPHRVPESACRPGRDDRGVALQPPLLRQTRVLAGTRRERGRPVRRVQGRRARGRVHALRRGRAGVGHPRAGFRARGQARPQRGGADPEGSRGGLGEPGLSHHPEGARHAVPPRSPSPLDPLAAPARHPPNPSHARRRLPPIPERRGLHQRGRPSSRPTPARGPPPFSRRSTSTRRPTSRRADSSTTRPPPPRSASRTASAPRSARRSRRRGAT